MNKFKKYFLAIGIIIILLVIIIESLPRQNSIQFNSPEPTTQRQYSWNTITPGITSEDEAKNVLGQPTDFIDSSENKRVLFFKSSNPNIDNTLFSIDGKVELIIEANMTDGKKIWDLAQEYGQPTAKLYGEISESGYFLYATPKKGIAYLANPIAGNVFEIWHYQPLNTVEEFLVKWANSYSTEQQEEIGE